MNKACELRPDPKDSCCKVMHCPDPNDIGHDAKPVGLSFDGCVHKKESYTKVNLIGGYKVRLIHVINIIWCVKFDIIDFSKFPGRKIL